MFTEFNFKIIVSDLFTVSYNI